MEEDLELEDLKQENCKSNCINCDYQETTQGCIKVHQQAKHETCDLCGKQLTTNGDITRHKQVTHDLCNHFCDTVNIKTQHDMIGHSCTTCHKTFSNFKMFNKHLVRKHTSGETCSFCEHCGDKFKNRKDIRKHVAASHGIIKQHKGAHRETCFFCEHCGTKLNVHHNLCNFCEYSITRKETLKVHEEAIHNKKCEEQLTVEKEVGEQVEHVDAQATEFLHEQSLLQYHGERSRLVSESKQLTVEILETELAKVGEQLEHVDAFEPVTIKHVPPKSTHPEHFGKQPEHLDNNSETHDIFRKL